VHVCVDRLDRVSQLAESIDDCIVIDVIVIDVIVIDVIGQERPKIVPDGIDALSPKRVAV
jgi:hypothetical protein